VQTERFPRNRPNCVRLPRKDHEHDAVEADEFDQDATDRNDEDENMILVRTIATAGILALIALQSTTPASAQATCDWYANTALQQQKKNVDGKCGFTGPSWSFDRTAHLQWCQNVAPDQWRRQAQFRDQELARCAASKRQ
jgi:hypothetical protein